MGGSSKKGGDDDIPQINPQQLIQQAISANRVGVNTPFGSQQYATGPNGQTTLNTTLSPEMQNILTQQFARVSAPTPQFNLGGAQANTLSGLNQRLDQRYGMGLPPPAATSPPGAGGGSAPVPSPITPPPAAIPPPTNNNGGSPFPQQPIPIPGQDNQPPVEYPSTDPDWLPRGQAAGGAHYGQEYIGGMCVAFDSLLPDGARAEDAEVGEDYPCHLPGRGFLRAPLERRGALAFVPCVRLVTESGASLRCSATTPFNFVDAIEDLAEGTWALAPDMLGKAVFVQTPQGIEEQEVVAVQDIGDEWVVPLSFGGKSFAAGDTSDALIYSHNMVKDNYANTIGAVYGFGDTGMSGSQELTGTIGQSAGFMGSPGISMNGLDITNGYTAPGQSAPAPAAPAGAAPATPTAATPPAAPATGQLSRWQRLAEAMLPGRQYTGGQFNGAGSVWRGIGSLATGLPIAGAYDRYQAWRDGRTQAPPAPPPNTSYGPQ